MFNFKHKNLVKLSFVFAFVFIFSFIFFRVGNCVHSAVNLGNSVLNKDKNLFARSYENLKPCKKAILLYDELPEILGNNTYIVLLQNNWELRPSGGFMGSYAIIQFEENILKDINVQDIYVPDGQIIGHVNPPKPVLQAFQQGFWRLRDANWDPDFQKSAENVAWFFDKGGVNNFDGIIALNFSTIQKVLEITGPIDLIDYNETLTADNFYDKAQSEAQLDFFPGSREKFHFLSDATTSLFSSLNNLSLTKKLQLGKIIIDEFNNGQVLLWSNKTDLNNLFLFHKWGGNINFSDTDFLYIVESNLSSNKSNCCVERSVGDSINLGELAEHNLKINFINKSTQSISNPPQNWDGDYKNYLRLIIPKSSKIKKVSIDLKDLEYINSEEERPNNLEEDHFYTLEERENYKIVGFWVITKAQESSEVSVEYNVSGIDKDSYEMFVKRQPGIIGFLYKLNINGKEIFDGEVERDINLNN